MAIGCKTTLRGEKMYEFADRLINLALPRVRDFRGVNPNAFDGRGNYALGIKEQIIFPEIEYDKVDKVRGMDVIFVTTAKTDEEARESADDCLTCRLHKVSHRREIGIMAKEIHEE